MLYVSEETGRPEVYLQTFPTPGERWRVTVDGGDWPAWRRDGQEIYYVSLDDRLMALSVRWREENGRDVPEFGQPVALFRIDAKRHDDRQYDTLDGEHFLVNRIVRSGARDPLTLVQGWAP